MDTTALYIPPVDQRAVVILSNRGPLSFRLDDDGSLTAQRGAGGLVSGLAPIVAGTGTTWIAAAMSEADRKAAARGVVEAEDLQVRLLDLDPQSFRAAYDVVCNATLWFCYHDLFDLARRPRIDGRWREAWEAYRSVNGAFATAAAEVTPEGGIVLVQDYHLALVASTLRAMRPDLSLVHFSHTPFCGPDGLRPLPDGVAAELLEGMAAHHACGFHTRRWSAAFGACAREFLGRDVESFVAPLGPDPGDMESVAASPACTEAGVQLDEVIGDRAMVLRVDRLEPSKNLLRGFHAFDDLLARHPQWRGRVVFVAFGYPSRQGLPEYLAYGQEAEGLVRQLNARWGTESWTPVVFVSADDFPRSVAALQRYDVLLVNPIRDGLNLVAKEGALVNRRDGVVVLSREAGVWEGLRDAGVVGVNPFDVAATSDALHQALSMPGDERGRRATTLRAAARSRTPSDWLGDQLAAAPPHAAA